VEQATTETAKYRILIADDHPIIRRGLRGTFERIAGVDICGEVENGRETIRRVRLDHPDLVVLDLKFADSDGIAILRELHAEFPEIKVLIVSMYMHENLVKQAIDLGASGYVLKADTEDALLRAIAHIRSGLTFFSEDLNVNVENASAKRRAGTAGPAFCGPLTAREVEVLRLLSQGNQNKQVAAALGISKRTVDVHRSHLMQKLKASSFSDLIKYALRNKIIE
jgi:DNA-binding NarL/FixJ family response regulator